MSAVHKQCTLGMVILLLKMLLKLLTPVFFTVLGLVLPGLLKAGSPPPMQVETVRSVINCYFFNFIIIKFITHYQQKKNF